MIRSPDVQAPGSHPALLFWSDIRQGWEDIPTFPGVCFTLLAPAQLPIAAKEAIEKQRSVFQKVELFFQIRVCACSLPNVRGQRLWLTGRPYTFVSQFCLYYSPQATREQNKQC